MSSPDNKPKRAYGPRVSKGFYVYYIVRRNGQSEEVFYTRKAANKYLIESPGTATFERVVRPKMVVKHEMTR